MILSETTILYCKRRLLAPDAPGIYIVYAWAKPLYVGSSLSLHQRLFNHTHRKDFDRLNASHIKLIEFEPNPIGYSRKYFSEYERDLIAKLQPELNYIPLAKRVEF